MPIFLFQMPGDSRTSCVLSCGAWPGALGIIVPSHFGAHWSPPSHMKRFSSALSQVSVALGSSSIRVAVLEENGDRVLMEGKFTHKVNTEGSVWSLEPGKCILVSAGRRQTLGAGLRPAFGNARQRAVETSLLMSRRFGVFPIQLLFAGDMWGRAPG